MLFISKSVFHNYAVN